MMIPLIVLIVVFTAILAVPSFAESKLSGQERSGKFWTDDRIYTDLFHAGIASELKDRCANIHVRHIRGMIFLQSLYTYARRQGHSLQEIRVFLKSEEEKARLRVWATTALKTQNVDVEDTAGFCAYGINEIDKNTKIGRLLWKK